MNTTATHSMTLAEFRELPDDPNVDRSLLDGELWEKSMTRRNRYHSSTQSKVCRILEDWVVKLGTDGDVFTGEIGCDLPATTSAVGIDIAYFDGQVLAAQDPEASFIQGAPVLAVEILSPSDSHDEITRKIKVYLKAGVQQVWIIDPDLRTLTVHRPQSRPELFATGQSFNGEPELPGLMFSVDDLFRRL